MSAAATLVRMKLDELAKAANIAPRTVRYYVQRGLLPAPAFRGKDSAYGAEHLTRLRAIRRLQEQQLPLDLIQRQLADLSVAAIDDIASGKVIPQSVAAPERIVTIPPPVLRPLEWTRHTIAPGIELHVAGDADADSQRLAEQLLTFARNNSKETL
jgi:DNA-binding transcriptional MerR regulator